MRYALIPLTDAPLNASALTAEPLHSSEIAREIEHAGVGGHNILMVGLQDPSYSQCCFKTPNIRRSDRARSCIEVG